MVSAIVKCCQFVVVLEVEQLLSSGQQIGHENEHHGEERKLQVTTRFDPSHSHSYKLVAIHVVELLQPASVHCATHIASKGGVG